MNQKQKVGYMVIGAVILVLGIIIGQFITPGTSGQSNSVFDTITCRKIRLVNEHGKPTIYLDTYEGGASMISMMNSRGNEAIRLYAAEGAGNSVTVYDKQTWKAVSLDADEILGNSVTVYSDRALPAISLDSTYESFDDNVKSNHVKVFDVQGLLKWETP